MKSALFVLAAILSFVAMPPAGAQEAYPSRPIRMLMPFGAGGTVDIMTRPLAAKLHEQLAAHATDHERVLELDTRLREVAAEKDGAESAWLELAEAADS